MAVPNVEVTGHTYITGNTFGNTTEPSARYWYSTRVSVSSVVYLTSVASTVSTSACVDESGSTSGSSSTFDSLDTDEREPRSCFRKRGESGERENLPELFAQSLLEK